MWKSETQIIHVRHQCSHMLHVLNFHWYGLVIICSPEGFKNFTELLKSSYSKKKARLSKNIYVYTHIHTHIHTHTHTHTFTYIFAREHVRLLLRYKAVPLQAWSGPEGSRKLRFPDFVTTARDGGKVVSLTHRPPLPPGNTPGTHFC